MPSWTELNEVIVAFLVLKKQRFCRFFSFFCLLPSSVHSLAESLDGLFFSMFVCVCIYIYYICFVQMITHQNVQPKIATVWDWIRIRIFIVPVQVYKEIRLKVHSRRWINNRLIFNTATKTKEYTKHNRLFSQHWKVNIYTSICN